MSDGFGSNGAMSDVTMEVYGGYLYVGLQRNGVGELWRTSDGTTWSPVFTNGLAPNNAYVSSMAEFNGAFYVGLLNDTSGGELWKTTNGTRSRAAWTSTSRHRESKRSWPKIHRASSAPTAAEGSPARMVSGWM